VRALPAHLVLVYDVVAGKEGLKLGQAVYTWQAREGRYQLDSEAQAQGMASLFLSGRITQHSEGRIGSRGLEPELYQQTRKDKLKGSARFDWAQQQLITLKGTETLNPGAQDILSFAFHLALTVTEDAAPWQMPVTNGRSLKLYQFQVLGRESVQLGQVTLEALRIRGSRPGEGNLEVWLAPALGWLPVHIHSEDDKGMPLDMRLASPLQRSAETDT
jgi:hypothetical protein